MVAYFSSSHLHISVVAKTNTTDANRNTTMGQTRSKLLPICGCVKRHAL